MCGLIDAKDGQPLSAGQVIAAEFTPTQFQQMLDARYFLTTGKGSKGTQASVLTPGKYRLNTELFKVHDRAADGGQGRRGRRAHLQLRQARRR
jgi:hypothetical protein